MRLIEDQKIKPSVVKHYLKEQGMIFTSTNAHELATNVYTIFLGCQEMDRLKQVIMHEANYEKSVLVNSELTSDTDDILEYFADEFNKRRSSGYKGISIEQPVISNNTMYLQLSYKKRFQVKIDFLMIQLTLFRYKYARKIKDQLPLIFVSNPQLIINGH